MKNELENKLLNNDMSKEIRGDLQLIKGPAYPIAEKLKERGYGIAGHARIRSEYPQSDFIGILKDRKPLEKKFLGIKYKKNQRALHIGTLWFNNNKKQANEEKNWTLDVYGRKYLANLTKIVDSLSRPYDVKLKVDLKSETSIQENYLSDLM